MLKGILFIIAIIVTFDIGKALLNSWQEEDTLMNEPEQIQEVEQVHSPSNSRSEDAEPTKAERLDLSLPEDALVIKDKPDSYLAEDKEANGLEERSGNFSIDSNGSSADTGSKIKFSGKPTLDFSKGRDETPELRGATFGVKVKLD